MFADDTAILSVHSSQAIATENLQKTVNKIVRWAALTLHQTKQNSSGELCEVSRHVPRYRIHLEALRIDYKKAQINLKTRQMYWLIGRHSKMKLENKRVIYQTVVFYVALVASVFGIQESSRDSAHDSVCIESGAQGTSCGSESTSMDGKTRESEMAKQSAPVGPEGYDGPASPASTSNFRDEKLLLPGATGLPGKPGAAGEAGERGGAGAPGAPGMKGGSGGLGGAGGPGGPGAPGGAGGQGGAGGDAGPALPGKAPTAPNKDIPGWLTKVMDKVRP
ncbi:glucuronosyltransferase [Sarracenia purpurea var. burkii]